MLLQKPKFELGQLVQTTSGHIGQIKGIHAKTMLIQRNKKGHERWYNPAIDPNGEISYTITGQTCKFIGADLEIARQ